MDSCTDDGNLFWAPAQTFPAIASDFREVSSEDGFSSSFVTDITGDICSSPATSDQSDEGDCAMRSADEGVASAFTTTPPPLDEQEFPLFFGALEQVKRVMFDRAVADGIRAALVQEWEPSETSEPAEPPDDASDEHSTPCTEADEIRAAALVQEWELSETSEPAARLDDTYHEHGVSSIDRVCYIENAAGKFVRCEADFVSHLGRLPPLPKAFANSSGHPMQQWQDANANSSDLSEAGVLAATVEVEGLA